MGTFRFKSDLRSHCATVRLRVSRAHRRSPVERSVFEPRTEAWMPLSARLPCRRLNLIHQRIKLQSELPQSLRREDASSTGPTLARQFNLQPTRKATAPSHSPAPPATTSGLNGWLSLRGRPRRGRRVTMRSSHPAAPYLRRAAKAHGGSGAGNGLWRRRPPAIRGKRQIRSLTHASSVPIQMFYLARSFNRNLAA